jgi:DNA-binding transcriptional ArsR family regulator
MTSADLLLHPVRLRIVQALVDGRELTTGHLAAELPDVPPATLYRHVARLAAAGVLVVVGERRIRGTTERTYRLNRTAATISPENVARMTPDEHRQAFLAYVAGLLNDLDRYLARDHIDPIRDGATYNLAAFWLDDAEFAEMVTAIQALLLPLVENRPRPGRTRRILGTVLIPGDPIPESGPPPDDPPTES